MALDEKISLDAEGAWTSLCGTAQDLVRQPEPRRRPLREAAATIYIAMALSMIAMPQAVSDRLADFPPGIVTDAARDIAAAVSDMADLTGLPQVYASTRRAFLTAFGRGAKHRSRS